MGPLLLNFLAISFLFIAFVGLLDEFVNVHPRIDFLVTDTCMFPFVPVPVKWVDLVLCLVPVLDVALGVVVTVVGLALGKLSSIPEATQGYTIEVLKNALFGDLPEF